jgi:type VI secretion system protein ImpA
LRGERGSMPSPLTLDFDALLAPIDDDHPAGQSVRYAGPYEAIQEARREDDNLDRGDWMRATKVADWAGVIATATDTLATQSKDLQIAVWLVEALIKRHGFAGLRDGLRLLWELQERFWDSLYPEIEDGDLEFRAAPLEWMNEKLAIPIRQIPLTQGLNGERYSWFDREESRVTITWGDAMKRPCRPRSLAASSRVSSLTKRRRARRWTTIKRFSRI